MRSKKVKQILGIGIIVVIIAGVVFIFTRLNKPAEQEQAMQTAPKFLTEETATEPVVEDEEFKWLDIETKVKDDMLVSTETKLRREPRDTAQEVATLVVDEWVKRDAYCTDLDGVELQWDRVTYNGKTGYVRSVDVDIMVAGDEMEEDKAPESASGVSEDHSIVEVNETASAEKPDTDKDADKTATDKSATDKTATDKPATDKPSEQTKPADTTPKEQTNQPAEQPSQPSQSTGGITPEGQALLDQIIADGGTLGDVELTHDESVATGHTGNVWE